MPSYFALLGTFALPVDFRRHYWPVCARIRRDNALGRLVFLVTRQIQHRRFARRALWKMVSREQLKRGVPRMSTVLWDTFTGSTPYGSVLVRALHPAFIGRFLWELTVGNLRTHS